jgi:Kdo2-lipid IVA lauroyltransferase/acyltransferase
LFLCQFLNTKSMNKLAFWVLLAVANLVALLPYRLLYVVADGIKFILYYLIRYRRKVVRTNLINSFPEKSTAELLKIEKDFYRNLADTILESIKMLGVSSDTFIKRVNINNQQVIDHLFDQGKSIFLAVGHSGNWEMLASYLSLTQRHESIAIYKKISDSNFDKLMKKIRQHLGGLLLFESRSAYRQLAAEKEKPRIVLILGDQTPQGIETDYWTNFLHQDTPFFNGLEKMARSLDFAVVYLDVMRLQRGIYEASATLLCENGKKTAETEISEQYVRLLEKSIQKRPDNWLWSHRRWKHKRQKAAV